MFFFGDVFSFPVECTPRRMGRSPSRTERKKNVDSQQKSTFSHIVGWTHQVVPSCWVPSWHVLVDQDMWVFPKIVVPQKMFGLWWTTLLKWDDLGVPFVFGKHPYITGNTPKNGMCFQENSRVVSSGVLNIIVMILLWFTYSFLKGFITFLFLWKAVCNPY